MRFFVNEAKRLVRTLGDMDRDGHVDLRVWREVDEQEYLAFRKETQANFNPKTLKKLRSATAGM